MLVEYFDKKKQRKVLHDGIRSSNLEYRIGGEEEKTNAHWCRQPKKLKQYPCAAARL